MTGRSPRKTTLGSIALVVVLAALTANCVGVPGALANVRSISAALVSSGVPPGVGGTHPSPYSTSASSTGEASGDQPQEISATTGWGGIDYRSACAGCVLPDPQIAMGMGYVVELTNGTERIWLTNGTEVENQSLDTLFNAGRDVLASPQVAFDPESLRFFVSADDLNDRQVLLGASSTSDPTGSWDLQSFGLGGGASPGGSWLGVDRTQVVVSVNVVGPSGGFEGAGVWVANKTSLVDGGSPAVAAVLPPDPAASDLLPATALSDTTTLYLLDDHSGPFANLSLYAISGAPPGSTNLSGPWNFSTSIVPPPNATEAGTTDLLGTGSGAIESAVWRDGTLWAASTGACVPSGDAEMRSCLHLWKLETASDTLDQDFLWSSGAGTYDFSPAVSMTQRGDLAVVFGEASGSLDPSIEVTGQAINDASGTLEAPIVIHNGTAPVDPISGCPNDVCPFGTDFSIAFNPLSACHFFTVGELGARNNTTADWRTWINQVTVLRSFPVTLNETGLPAGVEWSVTVNGVVATSTNASLEIYEPNGSFTFVAQSPIAGGPGTRYLPDPASGSFEVNATSVVLDLRYVRQYAVATSESPPGAGAVFPAGGWFFANSTVSLSALAGPGYRFVSWAGTGTGSISGGENPANLTVSAPINETAEFWASVTYAVTFTETGLPSGSNWTVTVDGVSNGSSGPSVGFYEPNGSYTFTVSTPIPGAPEIQYTAGPSSGSFDLSGGAPSLVIAYQPEFELTASPSSAALGVFEPSGGWFRSASRVNLSALAAPNEVFTSWNGTGTGAYSGSDNPAPVIVGGPITEVAEFRPTITYAITYTETGLPPGASWSVTTNGVVAVGTSGSLTFNEPNGTYSFSVSTGFAEANGTRFVPAPETGAFDVAGSPMAESVRFGAIGPGGLVPSPGSTSSGASGIPLWILGVVLVALLIIAVALMISLRREQPLPAPAPPPPPAWDESGSG